MNLKNYIALARPDHWVKNIFILPGTLIAWIYSPHPEESLPLRLFICISAACLIASANYTINEWLDRSFDKYHPLKKNRPSVAQNITGGYVALQYIILSITGLYLGHLLSVEFELTLLFFLFMGIVYNVNPLRSKDKVFMDVLSESINNPIRLMLGWFVVTDLTFPPSSLLMGYWFGGAYLMNVKRLAEYRFIGDPEQAGLYRRSFKYYDEELLTISSIFYAMTSTLFLGIFLVKHRIELILAFPFISLLFTWYFKIGLRKYSAAMNPEYLYREKKFMAFIVLLVIIFTTLLLLDIPSLKFFLQKSFPEL
jgi:4-hydroxybenzoate polyprenyltransferase